MSNKTTLFLVSDAKCDHCKVFLPIWKRLSTDPDLLRYFVFQHVPCDQYGILGTVKAVPKAFNFIPGFPTIGIVPGKYYATSNTGSYADVYSGSRDFDSVKQWAMSKVSVPSSASRVAPAPKSIANRYGF